MYPPVEASGGPEQFYIRSAWYLHFCIRLPWHLQIQTYPPSRGIWWSRAVLVKVILTFWRMQLRMQWTVRCSPLRRGIWWSRAVLHKVSLTYTVMHQVSLTFWGCRHTPSSDIWWSRAVLHKVSLTFTVMHQVGLTFCRLQLTVFTSMWSLQYTILSCQEYIYSAVKLSQFLQYLPKHPLQSSSCITILKDQKVGLDMERWLTPLRTSTYERNFTWEGNYLVSVFFPTEMVVPHKVPIMCWAKIVEMQITQKSIGWGRKVAQKSWEFDAMMKTVKQNHSTQNAERSRRMPQNKCKYCSTLHEPRRCPAYDKRCTWCGRANHFEQVHKCVSRRVMRDAVREKYREFHDTCQDVQELEVSTKRFDVVR